jgi:hypothetical protein
MRDKLDMHYSARAVVGVEKGDGNCFVIVEVEDRGCMQWNRFLETLFSFRENI